MAGKILKGVGIIFRAAVLMWPLLMLGGIFLVFSTALDGEPTVYEPRRDGYWQERITETLLINVLDSEVLYEMDTHGGFHGDGTAEVTLRLPKDTGLPEEIEGSPHWRELPLHRNVRFESYELVENGYYFFMDRFRKNGDIFDPSESNQWNMPNYTLAIWDQDENILYFLEVDT